ARAARFRVPALARGRRRARGPLGRAPGDLVRCLRLSGGARRADRGRRGTRARVRLRDDPLRLPRRAAPRPVRDRLTTEERREVLADPLGDRGHLELAAGDVADHLLAAQALALGPQLAQVAAGLALREPVVAEALAQMVPHLR